MKVALLFISIFVLFNVFEHNSSKYLLVNVDPGNNRIDPGKNRTSIGTWKGIGLQNEGNNKKLMPKI